MSRIRAARTLALLLAACLLATAMPHAAFAGHAAATAHRQPAGQPAVAFVFGRFGGNIRPFTVTIAASGVVTATGGIRVLVPHAQLSQDALGGLRTLAQAEGFQALPTSIEGTQIRPDAATLVIDMAAKNGVMKEVRVHAARNAAFAQLFAVLMAAAGVAY